VRPSPTEPTDADAFQAVCGHTHLFPGARCLLLELPDPDGFAADPRPIDLHLRFRDDVVTAAELRIEEQAGAVLDVPPYTTGAGTPITGRTWLIRRLARAGGDVELTIGSRL
jgi:hypothetical protein